LKNIGKRTSFIVIFIVLFAVVLASCNTATSTTSSTTSTTQTTLTSTTTTTPPTTTSTTLTTTTTNISITTTTPTTLTVTDHYGRVVTIKKFPQRIISLSPAHTEILFALGLGDRVVGVTDYSDYPPEAASKQNVGSYDTPNIEQIVALEPDLVLAGSEHQAEVTAMENRSITVVALDPTTVSMVLSTITFIGEITGQDKEAEALVADMRARINAITTKTESLTAAQKPRVFVVIWHDPIWTVGSGTFHDELIKMAGGVNIAGDLAGYTSISLENVITGNPQIIIAGVGMGEGTDQSLVFMQTDPRLSNVDARINNKIYGANMDIISRPGPRLDEALELLFKLIHPEMQ
jgi:iron complex transport system substrate-binding protein